MCAQLEEWDIQHEKLQRELNALGRVQRVEQYYDILINLDVKQKSNLTLELQFQVPTAYWVPIYDVNLEEKVTTLTLFANVFNTSQEEWNDVELEISSANLTPVRMIEPTPLVVQAYIPPPKPRPSPMSSLSLGKRAMKPGGGMPEAVLMEAEPMMEYAVAAAPPPPPMQQTVAIVENNLGAQSYQIPGKITIPG